MGSVVGEAVVAFVATGVLIDVSVVAGVESTSQANNTTKTKMPTIGNRTMRRMALVTALLLP